MSDFLNNLAARALRRQEPVRPRLASRFEPPGGLPAPLPFGPADLETTVFEPTPVAPSPTRPDAAPFTPHAHPTPHETIAQTPPPAAPRSDVFAEEERRARKEFRPALPVPPHGHETAAEGQTPFTPAERGSDAPPPTRTPAETLQPVEVVRQEQRPARAPVTDARGSEASKGALDRVRELEGRVAALEASRADERARSDARHDARSASVHATTRPESMPFTPAAAAPRAPERRPARSDEPPHVNVTIGRVDVRAVFAPAEPARAPAPRPKPTTLAEYLKQREGGRR